MPTTTEERSMSLWQINDTIAQLMEMRDEIILTQPQPPMEEVTAIEQELARYIGEALPTKVDGIRGFIRRDESIADAAEEEAKRFSLIAEHRRNRIKRLKQFVVGAMEAAGRNKLEGLSGGVLRLQKNGGKAPLTITDDTLIPEDCRRATITLPATLVMFLPMEKLISQGATLKYATDTDAVRKELEHGEAVSGARLEERGFHLRVE